MSHTAIIISGFHGVSACVLRKPDQIQEILVDEHRHDHRMQELLKHAKNAGIRVTQSSRQALDQLCDHSKHQGIAAIMQSPAHHEDLESFLDETASPFLLILDGVQDPHNLGACLRTANAAGVHAVIAPKDRAASITPIVSKVASGATLVTPFFQVTNLARTLKMLKERGIWLYGTSEHAADTYSEVEYSRSLAIVMGSEGTGMRRLTEESCDFLIKIPMLGTVPSLNVSVATGVCLFEVVRQFSVS